MWRGKSRSADTAKCQQERPDAVGPSNSHGEPMAFARGTWPPRRLAPGIAAHPLNFAAAHRRCWRATRPCGSGKLLEVPAGPDLPKPRWSCGEGKAVQRIPRSVSRNGQTPWVHQTATGSPWLCPRHMAASAISAWHLGASPELRGGASAMLAVKLPRLTGAEGPGMAGSRRARSPRRRDRPRGRPLPSARILFP
jgi:hypothetical protein